MRAVVARGGVVSVEDVDEPSPGDGQVLVESLACGICGSDIHFLESQTAMPDVIPPIVLGHEFVGRIADYGPGTDRRLPVGSLVTSVPFLDTVDGPQLVGVSPLVTGGLAERMVLQEKRLVPVPADLEPARAALTEPLAVGAHAVAKAGMAHGDVALVIGCGPVGLSVIACLKAAGHGPVLAADFSPGRRQLAEQAGADVVIDPAETSPYARWADMAGPPPLSTPLQETVQRPTTVVFECTGMAGVLSEVINAAVPHSRVIVVGVCQQPDTIIPAVAVTKELSLQFVFAYRPEEFSQSLRWIAEGRIDVGPFITAIRPLDDAAETFDDLRRPERHCKILLDPQLRR